ncbi:hypothetical protein MPC4_1440001 [Methylocella tundrae]|uniref:Uncharacterized protein n=1 Tax=Methylocella tundrae TaxID=227605 RepID=A0A8B6M4A9_METTU|nr:hypothetical protein MPC4_1440001 [Methylocella tundrae]
MCLYQYLWLIIALVAGNVRYLVIYMRMAQMVSVFTHAVKPLHSVGHLLKSVKQNNFQCQL